MTEPQDDPYPMPPSPDATRHQPAQGEATRPNTTRPGAADRRRRDLLIALVACRRLHVSSTCRLAREVDAWAAARAGDADALAPRLGVTPEALATALALRRRAGSLARKEERRAAELGASVVTAADPGYPPALLDLALPPALLYVRGRLPDGPGVTVVGSRHADVYGRQVAELFGRELAAAGAVVISGFARGVDAAAHRGALTAPEGRTVAVLGCGLGVDYPKQHRRLGAEIAGRGAVVTEFPVGMQPEAWQFPVRNRILAALAQATLVVRAKARSGSLITARHALELGRDVYAVPGPIFDDASLGPNALIRDGAGLVQHPRDILDHLRPPLPPPGDSVAAPAPDPAPGGLGGRLEAALEPARPASPEALAAAVGESVGRVMAALLELELAGRARREPGGAYTRRV